MSPGPANPRGSTIVIGPPVIRIELVPSRRLALGLCALHALTLVPVWAASPAPWAGVALSVMLAVHAAWSVCLLALLRHPRSVVELVLQVGRPCILIQRNGRRIEATVGPSTVVTGTLVVLDAAPSAYDLAFRRRYRIAIVRGMLAEDAFRQVRVLLKWGGERQQRRDPGQAAA